MCDTVLEKVTQAQNKEDILHKVTKQHFVTVTVFSFLRKIPQQFSIDSKCHIHATDFKLFICKLISIYSS